jgi:urea transport system permease protein
MPTLSRIRRIVLFCVTALLPLSALAALDAKLVRQLAAEDSEERLAAVTQLALQADGALTQRVLKAMSEDNLFANAKGVYFKEGEAVFDAASGAAIPSLPEGAEGVVVNNRLRAELDSRLSIAKLNDPDRKVRLDAAKVLADEADATQLAALRAAYKKERDVAVLHQLRIAVAQAGLHSAEAKDRLEAVKMLGETDSPNAKALLLSRLEKTADGYAEPDEEVRHAAALSLHDVESRLKRAEVAGKIFSGVSLGSILLLATLGLAIIYGVMGVINMAHGEFLMIGAYATYVIQGVFRQHFPAAQELYVLAAIPAAFFVTAMVGMALERLIIRHLYGRPLETLLATWGISLCLIQAARVIFGPQNVEVSNPDWLSGGVELAAGIMLPWNRIVIIAFSGMVLALMWGLLNLTRLGLHVRAVTQNRPMAGCVGVPTGRVDTLAFGLGAGIAGLGGVALSQIGNVGPDMGQGYIVDTFMVVVLGGVGQLAGAVWAALGLGILSKFLEGWAGAVIAKILVLVFIIIFIQKRPQGLFALKGRFADQ